MSTWISDPAARRRACLGAALTILLAGCTPDGGMALLGGGTSPVPSLVVAGGVAVAGPEGYCVDPVGTRSRGGVAFVLFGACAAMTGEGGMPARRAMLAAAVSSPGEAGTVAADPAALVAFFQRPEGRALLSRSGEADSVRLLASAVRDGVLYLHLRDTAPLDGAEVGADYWRAILDVGPHVVSLSVIPLAARPLGRAGGRALLESFVARTRAANAG